MTTIPKPGDRVLVPAEPEPVAQYPLTCGWCRNSPADHVAVYDYRHDTRPPERITVMVCGPCGHSVTILPASFERWWLFSLTSDGETYAHECAGKRGIGDHSITGLDALRPQVQQARDIHYEYACWHAELPGREIQEAREAGRVSAYDEVLGMLAEAGTGSGGSEGHD